jgi:hypothetical protein
VDRRLVRRGLLALQTVPTRADASRAVGVRQEGSAVRLTATRTRSPAVGEQEIPDGTPFVIIDIDHNKERVHVEFRLNGKVMRA